MGGERCQGGMSYRGSRLWSLYFVVQVATKDGGATGTVVQVPYPTRSDAESAMPPAKKEDASTGDEAAAALDLEEEKAKEKARKVIDDCCLWIDCSVVSRSGALFLCCMYVTGSKGCPGCTIAVMQECRTIDTRAGFETKKGRWASEALLCVRGATRCLLTAPSPFTARFRGALVQAAKLEAMQKKIDAMKARRKAA